LIVNAFIDRKVTELLIKEVTINTSRKATHKCRFFPYICHCFAN